MSTVINNVQNIQVNIGDDIHEFPKHSCRIGLRKNVLTVRDVSDDRREILTLSSEDVTSPLEANNTALALTLIGYLSTGVGAPSSSFGLDVVKGNFEGLTGVQIIGRTELATTTFSDIQGLGGILTQATSGETWEIVGSSGNDTSAGTGARTVSVTYLDDTFTLQTETLTMNGTTPVVFAASDAFRFRSATVLTAGSLGFNDGPITIRVSGGGASRGSIDYSLAYLRGMNESFTSHYTVEAGKTLYSNGAFESANKGFDIAVWTQFKLEGDTIWHTLGEVPQYQSAINVDFKDSWAAVPEKTDLKAIVWSSNPATIVNLNVLGVLETN